MSSNWKANLSIGVVLCSLTLVIGSCGSHTSDRALTTLFLNNQSVFDEGVQLTKRHPDLIYIGPNTILSNSYPAPIDVSEHPLDYRKLLSDTEWRAFQSVFQKLRLVDAIKVSPAGVAYFAVDKVSMSNGDSEKGIVYSERPFTPLVQSLDRRRYPPNVVYKKLKPRWYLYLSFD